MEPVGKAALFAGCAVAAQAFIRFSPLRDKMVAHREMFLILCLIVGLVLVASSLALLARQRLSYAYRTRHFWRPHLHRKKSRGHL